MTVQAQIEFIPLNKLVASPRNVRRKDRKVDIDALAASITAHGLLQNLCVVPGEGDRFEVDAGGRRLQALKQLAKSGVLAKDFPVPCHVVAREEGREVSLIENVQRVAMDAMDEVDAFAALLADGLTADEVAKRFGVTRRHVDQRFALARLSPKIKAAWKRGDVTLDAARAFCLVDDHAQQEAVFRSLSRPISHGATVRGRLTDGRIRTSDRLAVFVGLDAYEAAGGKLLHDLFDTETVFVDNPALLTKLADDKLGESRGQWLGEGWNWVELHLGDGRGSGLSSTRLHPEWRDPTPEEQAELDRISAEIATLDAVLEASSVDDDPRWSTRDDLEAAYEIIRQAGRCWTPEVRQLAGVLLSVDRDGAISATEGLVRVEDQKRVEAFLKQRRAGERDDVVDENERDETPARVSALPKSVNRDLTTARTCAIRSALAGDPDVALALCVASMARRSLHTAEMPGVALSAQMRSIVDVRGLEDARAAIQAGLPEGEEQLLEWAFDMSRERLLGVLAVLVASSVDLAHEDTSAADRLKQAVADQLSQELEIDMNAFWKADLTFWVRLPKSELMSALAEAPGIARKSERTRDDLLKSHAKLRKNDLAVKVADEYEGSAYLPDILVTPLASGSLSITPEGAIAIALPAVAAE